MVAPSVLPSMKYLEVSTDRSSYEWIDPLRHVTRVQQYSIDIYIYTRRQSCLAPSNFIRIPRPSAFSLRITRAG